MWNKIMIVTQKELIDAFRDQRTLVNTILSALLGPLMLFGLFTVLGQTTARQTERPLELPIIGAEYAPDLISFLQANNVQIVAAPDDPVSAVRNGDLDLALVISADYQERLQSGLPVRIQMIADSSRQTTQATVGRAETLLSVYSSQLGALRLQARGISPSVVSPILIEEIDQATPQSRAAMLLNILPYFLIFAVFLGGMSLTIDMTAGERERGSLEPLLISPLSRSELMLGKLTASLVPTVLSVGVALIGFALIINFSGLGDNLGIQLSLDLGALIGIFLITIPIMLLAAALQMLIATGSRSVKEAQSYLGFLPLIPALPGLFLTFVPIRPTLWMMSIPTFGQQLLINQLLRGEAVNLLFVMVSSVTTLLVGVLLTFAAVRLFAQERILFAQN
jgi:sodium transport system permease protein